MALAFIPPVDVISVFEDLMNSPFFTDNIDEIRDFLNYFEDTWIGRPGRRGLRTAAIFPIPLWNVYRQALEELPKTYTPIPHFASRLRSKKTRRKVNYDFL